jgi:hypothetical protein
VTPGAQGETENDGLLSLSLFSKGVVITHIFVKNR